MNVWNWGVAILAPRCHSADVVSCSPSGGRAARGDAASANLLQGGEPLGFRVFRISGPPQKKNKK